MRAVKCETDVEGKVKQFIYSKLKRLILKHKMDKVSAVAKALKVIFPEDGELAICDLIFDICRDRYRDKATEKIIQYFNHLINECYRYDILFLQRGAELYRLGKWSYNKDPCKAKMYLKFYLCEHNQYEGVYGYRWRKHAERLLNRI